jgi:MFS family permease
MTSSSGSLAPFRHANFRWYFIAMAVNMAGSTMAGVALAFAVLSIDDSPSALGVVMAAESVPTVLFLLFGGVIADRLPLTVVLRVGMVVEGVVQAVTAALVITGAARIWMLVVLAFVSGLAMAIGLPALLSIMRWLVPLDLLQQANALQSFSRGVLRIAGPAVAGLLVVAVGAGWALAFDAATWLAAATVLVKVTLPPKPPRTEATSTLADLREGWSYFRTTTWLWVVVLAFTFLNAIIAGAMLTVGPAQAKETFGPEGWGLMLSAESLGLIATTLVLLRRRLQRPLVSGMLGMSLFAVPLVLLGAVPHVGLLMVFAFAAGAGMELFNIGWQVTMQEHVPEAKLSRVISYDILGSEVAVPAGQLVYGPLGVRFGYEGVLVASGFLFLVISLLPLTSRSVRDLRRVPAPTVQASAG